MWKATVLFVCITSATICPVLATDLSYDGELSANGAPADGWFDLHFQIFDAPEPGQSQPVGREVFVPGILVTGGKFSVEIDPGVDLDDLTNIWLEIGVKHAGNFGDFTPLEPRQRLNPHPATKKTTKAGVTPTGAIVFFDSATCPQGWSEYVPARGRFVLGLPQGGTVGASFGSPLSNLEERKHSHSFSQYVNTSWNGVHRHTWSTLYLASNGDRIWTSFDSAGEEVLATAWATAWATKVRVSTRWLLNRTGISTPTTLRNIGTKPTLPGRRVTVALLCPTFSCSPAKRTEIDEPGNSNRNSSGYRSSGEFDGRERGRSTRKQTRQFVGNCCRRRCPIQIPGGAFYCRGPQCDGTGGIHGRDVSIGPFGTNEG